VQHTIPQLDWRTAVLDTDQCRSILNNFLAQDGQNQTTKQCDIVSRKAVEIGPSDVHEWKGKHHRNEEILAPFRVSDQLRTPDKLFQEDLLTKQLNDCHIDEVTRITLQSSQSNTKTIIEPTGEKGDDIVFVLSGNFNEHNVYHILHMSSLLPCLYIGLEDYSQLNQSISLLLPLNWNNGVGLVTVEALATTYNANIIRFDGIDDKTYSKVIHVHGWIPDAQAMFRSASLGFQYPLWDSFKFELYRQTSSFGIIYANAIHQGNAINIHQQRRDDEGKILIVQRKNSRRIVGSTTGTFAEVVDAMCKLNLPVDVVEFESLSPQEQIDVAGQSTILVGAHGAGLSHAMFVQEGGAVVEILMRQNFDHGSDYHKADFANLVRFYGKKYVYYDSIAIELNEGVDNLSARLLIVDAQELAQALYCLYHSVLR